VAEPEGFREFVQARSGALLQSAWLLTGQRATAQDLLQTALAKTYPRWDRLRSRDAAEAYVRRVLVSTYVSWTRRRWTGEHATGELPEHADARDPYAAAELRADVARALGALPRRQRAVVVLRYFDDLTESQVAAAMGCSVGTVKSQTAKALAKLRASGLVRLPDDEEVAP
jgi:RNA polymerase sigma-70 factor (sigma-E family)